MFLGMFHPMELIYMKAPSLCSRVKVDKIESKFFFLRFYLIVLLKRWCSAIKIYCGFMGIGCISVHFQLLRKIYLHIDSFHRFGRNLGVFWFSNAVGSFWKRRQLDWLLEFNGKNWGFTSSRFSYRVQHISQFPDLFRVLEETFNGFSSELFGSLRFLFLSRSSVESAHWGG